MKKNLTIVFLLFSFLPAFTQKDMSDASTDIKKWQKELNAEYNDPDKTPLDLKDMKKFKGHEFYIIDTAYRIMATLAPFKNESIIKFKTSLGVFPEYRKYGELYFTINGQALKLNVYQSLDLLKKEEYQDYLFLPFTDSTTAEETYGGGRYIDLKIPKEGNTILLDFNKAYNPYCAYSSNYACPLVPDENDLKIKIRAGIKYTRKK